MEGSKSKQTVYAQAKQRERDGGREREGERDRGSERKGGRRSDLFVKFCKFG